MKICVSSAGKEKSSSADPRFGRCQYFVIVDTEAVDFKVIENDGITSQQGAGIAAAQQVLNEKVDVVITGNMGPNAMKLINGADIKVYKFQGSTVEEEVKLFLDNKLTTIDKPAPAHHGMGHQHGKG